MATERFYDERDWEPGGFYYDGPIDIIRDSDDEDDDNVDDAAAPKLTTFKAPPRRPRAQGMPGTARVIRYIDEEI